MQPRRSSLRTHFSYLLLAGLTILVPALSQGSSLTYYASRTAFNSAEPGLPMQVFQPLFPTAVIASPLSSSSNNSDFVSGSILPGFAISNMNSALSATGLYISGNSVASNYFEDPLVISFTPGVSAVGADFTASSGGAPWAGTFTAKIYDGSTLLDSATYGEAANQSGFLGFSSTTSVTSMVISFQPTMDVDWAPHVANLAFGSSTTSVPVSTVPEPAPIFLCTLSLVAVGFHASRGRRGLIQDGRAQIS